MSESKQERIEKDLLGIAAQIGIENIITYVSCTKQHSLFCLNYLQEVTGNEKTSLDIPTLVLPNITILFVDISEHPGTKLELWDHVVEFDFNVGKSWSLSLNQGYLEAWISWANTCNNEVNNYHPITGIP